jgi:hypothetical protein
MITMMYLTPATGVPPLVLADGTDETVRRRRDGPFHVAALAGEEISRCRQRVQQDTCGLRRPRTSKGPTEAINGGLERPWVLQRHQLHRPSFTRHRQHRATNTPLYYGERLKSPENLRRTSRTRTIARGEVDGLSGRVVPRV